MRAARLNAIAREQHMLHLYSPSEAGQLFIGVAGWNHPHWQSLLETQGASRPHAVVQRLSEMFNLLEITASYYHPPEAKTVQAWLREVNDAHPFYFTARLWNKLVRERALLLQNDIRLMKAVLSPLHEAGRLGAVLVSVLSTLRYSESNELWLLGLLDTFAEYPLFVENLHASWAKYDTLLRLQDRGIGVVQTAALEALRPEACAQFAGKRIAYVRCGDARQSDQEQRYSTAELTNFALKIKQLLPYLSACFVVFTNHAHGYALADALQLQSACTGAPLLPPPNLLHTFPELQNLSAISRRQRDLFEESI